MIPESNYYLRPFSTKQIEGFISKKLPRKLKKKIISHFRDTGMKKESLNANSIINFLKAEQPISEYLKNHWNTKPNELPF